MCKGYRFITYLENMQIEATKDNSNFFQNPYRDTGGMSNFGFRLSFLKCYINRKLKS